MISISIDGSEIQSLQTRLLIQKSSCVMASEKTVLLQVFPSPFWGFQALCKQPSAWDREMLQEREVQKCGVSFSSLNSKQAFFFFFIPLAQFSNTKRQNIFKNKKFPAYLQVFASCFLSLFLGQQKLPHLQLCASFNVFAFLHDSLLTSGNSPGISGANLTWAKMSLLYRGRHWTCVLCLIHAEVPNIHLALFTHKWGIFWWDLNIHTVIVTWFLIYFACF